MKKLKLFKKRYLIVFYDKTDEVLLYLFDNITERLKYQGKEITQQNINNIKIDLYRALKTKEHFVRFLTGEVMRVYLIDYKE